MLNLIQ